MKILLATDTYYPDLNGTAYFIYRLARTLSTRGHKVFVIAPSQTLENTKHVDDKGVTVYGVRSLPVPNYPNFRFSPLVMVKPSIQRIVREVAPDIIHIQQHFMVGKGVFDVGKELGLPMIGTNHFLPENLVHYVPLPKRAKAKIVRYSWNQFLKIYNQLPVVTTPTVTAASIVAEIGLNKAALPISNGIDLKRFSQSKEKGDIRQKYNIPNRKVLLFVGRLDREKQLDLVLNALPHVLLSCEMQLVIAGAGALRSQLESLTEKLGITDHVTFTGFVPDAQMANLYRSADAFVMASIAELQSIATMEAMASGLPIIAADAKALPELVHDGENGFLFPPDSQVILAQRIVTLFSNEALRLKMSQESLRIIQKHDVNIIIKQFETVYRHVINQTRNGSFDGDTRITQSKKKPVATHRGASINIILILLSTIAASSIIHYGLHNKLDGATYDKVSTRHALTNYQSRGKGVALLSQLVHF